MSASRYTIKMTFTNQDIPQTKEFDNDEKHEKLQT